MKARGGGVTCAEHDESGGDRSAESPFNARALVLDIV